MAEDGCITARQRRPPMPLAVVTAATPRSSMPAISARSGATRRPLRRRCSMPAASPCAPRSIPASRPSPIGLAGRLVAMTAGTAGAASAASPSRRKPTGVLEPGSGRGISAAGRDGAWRPRRRPRPRQKRGDHRTGDSSARRPGRAAAGLGLQAFVYLAAMNHGFTPSSIVLDAPTTSRGRPADMEAGELREDFPRRARCARLSIA
jgi:hypothetical protein